jgi:hypothetical protein
MRRVGKIILEYTKEELAHILQNTLATVEKVSIESMEFKDEKFIFHCVEGINQIPQKDQITKIDFSNLLSNKITKSKGQWGIKKAVIESLAEGVKCPLDKLIEELILKGYRGEESYFRNYLITKKELFTEVEPNVFQLTEFFNKK